MLLETIEPEIINPDAREGLIIVCEHASNHIPAPLGNLGLDPKHLGEHIALDIGAEDVTRAMCEMMGVTAIVSNVSRLVIDCNREPCREHARESACFRLPRVFFCQHWQTAAGLLRLLPRGRLPGAARRVHWPIG